MDIASFIKKVRTESFGESQRQFAKRVGVSGWMVGQWERGEFKPNPQNLERIAEIAGVDNIELIPAAKNVLDDGTKPDVSDEARRAAKLAMFRDWRGLIDFAVNQIEHESAALNKNKPTHLTRKVG